MTSGCDSSTSAPGDIFATTHWTVVLGVGRHFGLRWQAERDTALGSSTGLPHSSRARLPKAPSPLRFAGAVQDGLPYPCASVLKLTLL